MVRIYNSIFIRPNGSTDYFIRKGEMPQVMQSSAYVDIIAYIFKSSKNKKKL